MTVVRRLLELTSRDIVTLARQDAVAIVPVGQVVPHGGHLPLGTDVYVASGVAEALAECLERHGAASVVAPDVAVGHSPLHNDAAGALSLRASAHGALLADVAASLARSGLRRRVLLLHAPGSWPSVSLALEADDGPPPALLTIDLLAWLRGTARAHAAADTINAPDGHAGALETSVMLHLRPELVDTARAPSGAGPLYGHDRPEFRGLSTNQRLASFGVTSWSRLGSEGVVGDASRADAALGRTIVTGAVESLARHILDVCLAGDAPADSEAHEGNREGGGDATR